MKEKTEVNEWQDALALASKDSPYSALFKKINRSLSVPSRSRKAVSLFKISTNTSEGDNVIVPRKILSTGAIDHKVTIAALEYSDRARTALKEAGCNVVGIKEMLGRQKLHLII